MCKCNKVIQAAKVDCQCGSEPVSNNFQGFPRMTVQQPLLEAYMERVVRESMEKLVQQLLTANASQS